MKFQFHKGAIRTVEFSHLLGVELNFNSIKVRLELHIRLFFQVYIRDFNSIKVRLELHIRLFFQVYIRDFNSIKVRLEQLCGESLAHGSLFQFHKGAIRTG